MSRLMVYLPRSFAEPLTICASGDDARNGQQADWFKPYLPAGIQAFLTPSTFSSRGPAFVMNFVKERHFIFCLANPFCSVPEGQLHLPETLAASSDRSRGSVSCVYPWDVNNTAGGVLSPLPHAADRSKYRSSFLQCRFQHFSRGSQLIEQIRDCSRRLFFVTEAGFQTIIKGSRNV